MLTTFLFASTLATNRVVPGVSLGDLRIGQPQETVTKLGTPYAGDAGMGKIWSTWLGRGNARLDVYSSLATDRPVIRVIRATSPAFRTAGGLGPGVTETRMRSAFPRARDVGTYRRPDSGPPIHLFDDLRGGIAFELLRGKCIAVAVHAKGRGLETETNTLRSYLSQPLRKIGRL